MVEPGGTTEGATTDGCECGCHTGAGPWRPPCTVPGGCGPHDPPPGRLCPGRCNRGWRRFWAATGTGPDATLAGEHAVPVLPDTPGAPKPPRTPPAAGEPVWCAPCASEITSALSRLPDLAAALFARTDGRLAAAGWSERTGRRKVSGSPSGSPAWDAVDEIARYLIDLEDRVRYQLGHNLKALGEDVRREVVYDGAGRLVRVGGIVYDSAARRTISEAVSYLNGWRREWLAWPPGPGREVDAVRAGRRILDLARRAERGAGVDELVHHLPLRCLQCDALALERADGSATVVCRVCRKTWPQEAYERLAAAYAHVVRHGQEAGE